MNLPHNILETTQADIQRLIADPVQEGVHIDLKRELPLSWDASAKHELLAECDGVHAGAILGGQLPGDVRFGRRWSVPAMGHQSSRGAEAQPSKDNGHR